MPYPQQNRQAEIKINVEVKVGCSLLTLVEKKGKRERHGISGERDGGREQNASHVTKGAIIIRYHNITGDVHIS